MNPQQADKRRPYRVNMLWLAMALAASFWVVDSWIDAYFIIGEGSFVEHLLPNSPLELYMRPLVCLLLVAFGVYSDRTLRKIGALEAEKRELLQAREQAWAKVAASFVPICVECSNIRDESGQWVSAEAYVIGITGQQLTHGLCPHCSQKMISGMNT